MNKLEMKIRKNINKESRLIDQANKELEIIIKCFRQDNPKLSYVNILYKINRYLKAIIEGQKAAGALPTILAFITAPGVYVLTNVFFNPVDPESLVNQVQQLSGGLQITIGILLLLVFLILSTGYFVLFLRVFDNRIRRKYFINTMMLELLEERIKKYQ